jgi:hypothetical protein
MLNFSFWNNPAPEGFGKARIEALADGIFSVAMTLLFFFNETPTTEIYTTESALWQRLLSLEGTVTIYVISFLVTRHVLDQPPLPVPFRGAHRPRAAQSPVPAHGEHGALLDGTARPFPSGCHSDL